VIDKEPFYRKLRAALADGGAFAFADELVGAMPDIQRRSWDRWLEFANAPDNLSKSEITDIIEHMEAFDHYETLPRQMELLGSAGFENVDCVWRYLNYAVFVAR
jgi:tRNA (cmo5U34)-methyltransferase